MNMFKMIAQEYCRITYMHMENEILVILKIYFSFSYTIEMSKRDEFGGSSLFIS